MYKSYFIANRNKNDSYTAYFEGNGVMPSFGLRRCTKMRLAAGLRPDPLGELTMLP